MHNNDFADAPVETRDSCKCGDHKCKCYGGMCPYLMPQMYNYPNMYPVPPMNYYGGFGGFNPMMYGGRYPAPVMAEDDDYDDDQMVANMNYNYYQRPRPHHYPRPHQRPRPHYYPWPYYYHKPPHYYGPQHHGYPYSRDEYDED